MATWEIDECRKLKSKTQLYKRNLVCDLLSDAMTIPVELCRKEIIFLKIVLFIQINRLINPDDIDIVGRN